jgi:hypothetical protein
VVLTRLESPGEAWLADVAASAHLFGVLDLREGRAGVADGEEEFRVLFEAGRTVTPVHSWDSYQYETGCSGPIQVAKAESMSMWR